MVLVGEGHGRKDGPKNLLLGQAVLYRHIAQQSGGLVIAPRRHAVGDAAVRHGGDAIGRGLVQEALDPLKLAGADQRSEVEVHAGRAHLQGTEGLSQAFEQRLVNALLNQHPGASAAGLAYAGMHPVIAIYSTFLNRAFDQLLLDVALHNAGVTFVLDRAGITGDDGPSHHGIWDLALTGIVPTLHVAAPRDAARLRETLRESLDISDAPSLIRFPKGAVQSDIPAFERRDGIDVLYRGESADVLLVSVGAMAAIAVEAASQAYREGVGVTVIDPRWVKPLPASLITMAQRYKSVVVIEDGIRHGGIASSLSEMFRDARLEIAIHSIGVPLEFIEHSKRGEILEDLGITAQKIAREIVEWSSTSVPMQFPEHENADRPQTR